MPIVRIEIVDAEQTPKGSERLADQLGEILSSENGHTWLRILPMRINTRRMACLMLPGHLGLFCHGRTSSKRHGRGSSEYRGGRRRGAKAK